MTNILMSHVMDMNQQESLCLAQDLFFKMRRATIQATTGTHNEEKARQLFEELEAILMEDYAYNQEEDHDA